MYTPSQIADYFLFNFGDDQEMTPMKIIKLTYIAHGWYLGQNHKPLLSENAEAWKYGPVLPSLYYRFKSYGNGHISERPNHVIDNADITEFLNGIWEAYGSLNGVQLSSLTHMHGTPWHQVWTNALDHNSKLNLTIPNRLIENHYALLDANQTA